MSLMMDNPLPGRSDASRPSLPARAMIEGARDDRDPADWQSYVAGVPPGWSALGVKGTRAECVAYIEQVWTDMRPLGVRRQLPAAGQCGGPRA
jgi:uncharacterized protein YbdZ (MbtH family)